MQKFVSLMLLTGLVLLSHPSAAQYNGDTRYNNNYPTRLNGSGNPGRANAVNNTANQEIRLQQLENEIATLTGKVEQYTYQIRQLQQQLDRVNSDLTLRVNDLEQKSGDAAAMKTISPNGNASNGALNGNGYQWNSGAAKNAQNASPSTPDALYDQSFGHIKNGQFDQAEQGFKAFLNDYPDHKLAGNAQYWLGETYYVRKNYQSAAQAFAKGYQKYSDNNKAPDNLLKLALSLHGLEKTQEACVTLGQLVTQYSTGTAAVITRAKQEQDRFGCS